MTSLSKTKTNEILTLQEMYERYPDQWILIAYTKLDENLNIIRGEVLAHAKDYDQLYENSLPRKGKSIAIEYTGTVDDDIPVIL